MKVASSLVGGRDPSPELAAEAVHNALQAAGVERADSVLLFLSRDYVRHAQPAIIAAARAAGTLQVSGCTAYGLLTNRAGCSTSPALRHWSSRDRPRQPATGASRCSRSAATIRCPTTGRRCRRAPACSTPRPWPGRMAGWPARLGPRSACRACMPGLASSPGLRLLSLPLTVTPVTGLRSVRQLAASPRRQPARCLPAELRDDPPLHHIVVPCQPGTPAVAILAANADGSLTLAEALESANRCTLGHTPAAERRAGHA
jgi:hypothetical protein